MDWSQLKTTETCWTLSAAQKDLLVERVYQGKGYSAPLQIPILKPILAVAAMAVLAFGLLLLWPKKPMEEQIATIPGAGADAKPGKYVPSDPAGEGGIVPNHKEEITLEKEDTSDPQNTPAKEKEDTSDPQNTPAKENENQPTSDDSSNESETIAGAVAAGYPVWTIDREFTYKTSGVDDYKVKVTGATTRCRLGVTDDPNVNISFEFYNCTNTPTFFEKLFTVHIYQRGNEEIFPIIDETAFYKECQYVANPSKTYRRTLRYKMLYPNEPMEIFISPQTNPDIHDEETCPIALEIVDRKFTVHTQEVEDYNPKVLSAYSYCHLGTTKSKNINICFQFTNATHQPRCFDDLFTVKIYQRENEELLRTSRRIAIGDGPDYSIAPSETHGFTCEYNLLYPDEPIEIFIYPKNHEDA